jgi:DNA-binding PadR family transcriptional regulator
MEKYEYYQITPKGRKTLVEAKEKVKELILEINE